MEGLFLLMTFITCCVAPCSAGCWCCMDNAVQPINDAEVFTVSDNLDTSPQTAILTPFADGTAEPNATDLPIEQQAEIKDENRPTSATSTTSTKIMETNTSELMD